MEIFWFIIIAIVLTMFFILDGYDFGAGIIHLFFAKTEDDRRIVAKSAGLFWDSNEVWLVAGGGLLFMAFPTLYASAFSGFYLPLMMVLWLIVFRAIGLELRGHFHFQMWRGIWDRAFGVSSLLLALFFGIALGNIVRGVNLGGVENGVSTYEAHFFFLPLWNSSFSPSSTHPGIIDWFTIIIGLLSVVTLSIHGAAWVILKTNATINKQLKKTVFKLTIVLVCLTVLSLAVWHIVHPNPLGNFGDKPYLIIFPLIYLSGIAGLILFKTDNLRFLSSTLVIIGGITSSLASIFPVVLPSTNSVNESLTIYNTTSSDYALTVAVGWGVLGFILLFIYMFVQKKLMGGKIDDINYGDH